MKRMAIFFGVLILLYSIYYDLNTGTLRFLSKETKAVVSQPQESSDLPSVELKTSPDNSSISYIEMKVKPGDTVLSLVEDLLDESLPVSIEQVVTDFEELNDVSPSKIQIGKTYKIPKY